MLEAALPPKPAALHDGQSLEQRIQSGKYNLGPYKPLGEKGWLHRRVNVRVGC